MCVYGGGYYEDVFGEFIFACLIVDWEWQGETGGKRGEMVGRGQRKRGRRGKGMVEEGRGMGEEGDAEFAGHQYSNEREMHARVASP